jgi:DNA-binding MarR family transcriptional regulator
LEGEELIEIAIVETDLRRRAVWLTEQGARRLASGNPDLARSAREAGEVAPAGFGPPIGGQSDALIRD